MEFLEFLNQNQNLKELNFKNEKIKDSKNLILFQFSILSKDIYILFKYPKQNVNPQDFLEKFLNQPIYIGELWNFIIKNKDRFSNDVIIYVSNLIQTMNNMNTILYYKDIVSPDIDKRYYITEIQGIRTINFVEY